MYIVHLKVWEMRIAKDNIQILTVDKNFKDG